MNLMFRVNLNFLVVATALATAVSTHAKGQRTDLSREAVTELAKISDGKPFLEKTVTVASAENFELTLPLRENDVFSFHSTVNKFNKLNPGKR